MKIHQTVVLIVGLLVLQAVAQNCNATHFDFVGSYSLGKQDELNRTFTKLQEKITLLSNVTNKVSDTISYTIFNATPVFSYRDSKQKAEINGNNTIVIEGGVLSVDISFQWSKKSIISRNGTATATGVSKNITFAKYLSVQNDSSFHYQLLDSWPVLWSEDAFSLTRVDPADVSADDKAALTTLVNYIENVTTLRIELQQEIDKLFSYILGNCLHDEHQPIDNHFDYIWQSPGKANVTIPFQRKLTSIDLEQPGLQLNFEIRAENFTDWKCTTRDVPSHPLQPEQYGHTQQFVSFDFYKNVLNYAIVKGLLTTDLTRESWQSRMFQFYAGDLYDIFPKVRNTFYASDPVTGNCKATTANLQVRKSGVHTFNVSIHFACELNINRTKIVSLDVGLVAEVEGIPTATALDFRFRRHDEYVSYYPTTDYNMQNFDLANLMVHHSLNRLYDGKLFGSGWPLSPPRDFPQMTTRDNYTIVYDSTHIQSSNKAAFIE